MSQPASRRSALGRADLVAALAQGNGTEEPDATARYVAAALHLEWFPPRPK